MNPEAQDRESESESEAQDVRERVRQRLLDLLESSPTESVALAAAKLLIELESL